MAYIEHSHAPSITTWEIIREKQRWHFALTFVTFITLVMLLARQLGLINSHIIVYYLALAVPTWLCIAALYSTRYHYGRLDLFHPLIYSLWYFYLPTITFGVFQFIDPTVPISTGYRFDLADRAGAFEITLYGWVIATFGLVLGYYLPYGRDLGRMTLRLIPFKPPRDNGHLKRIVIFFTIIGMFTRIALYFLDSRRLSGLTSDSPFTGIFDLIDQFYMVIVIVAIYYASRERGWARIAWLYAPIAIFGFLVAGSRAYFISWVILPILFAYQYAKREISLSKVAIFALPFVLFALIIGWNFATAFREERWRLQSISGRYLTLDENIALIRVVTSDLILGTQANSNYGLLDSFIAIGDRTTGTIGTMALFMTYSDLLRDEEVARGLDHNIIDTLRLAFIPRFLDPERPSLSANLELTRLYMGTEGNHVAISYPVDLYRNFGWIGIFVGMVIVGVLYRFYYAWLIESGKQSPFRLGIYYVILASAFVLGNEYGLFFAGSVRAISGFAAIYILYNIVVTALARKNGDPAQGTL